MDSKRGPAELTISIKVSHLLALGAVVLYSCSSRLIRRLVQRVMRIESEAIEGPFPASFPSRFQTLRELYPHEVMMAASNGQSNNFRTSSASVVNGTVTVHELRLAMELLLEIHPYLRCGVHKKCNGKYYLHEYENASEMLEVIHIPRENNAEKWRQEWHRIAQHRVKQFCSTDSLLFDLYIVSDDHDNLSQQQELIVNSSHVILDGTSHVAFHTELIQLCHVVQELTGSGRVAMDPALFSKLKKAVRREARDVRVGDERLRQTAAYDDAVKSVGWWRRFLLSSSLVRMFLWMKICFHHGRSYQPISSSSSWFEPSSESKIKGEMELIVCQTLTADLTKRIIATAKAGGVSVNALLLGAFVHSHAIVHSLPEGRLLSVTIPVRVSSIVTPPVPRTEVHHGSGACLFHFAKVLATSSKTIFPWKTYASCYQEQVHLNPLTRVPHSAFRCVVEGRVVSDMYDSWLFHLWNLRRMHGRIANLCLTNMGDLTDGMQNGIARGILDRAQAKGAGPQSFVQDRKASPLVLSSVFVSQTVVTGGTECMLSVLTLNGVMHLCWTFSTPIIERKKAVETTTQFLSLLLSL